MSALGQYLERGGIPTASISLIRVHTERVNPPRALWVPFELGRPFGPPNDADFQRQVLAAVLGLFEAKSGPVLEDFPEDAPESDEVSGWACPVDFGPREEAGESSSALGDALNREIGQLATWYELSRKNKGRTTVGLSGLDIVTAARFVVDFLGDQTVASPSGQPSAEALRVAIEDLKAYYLEAATAKPGTVATRDLNNWLWGETTLGKIIFELREICLKADDPGLQVMGRLGLVPASQAFRLRAA